MGRIKYAISKERRNELKQILNRCNKSMYELAAESLILLQLVQILGVSMALVSSIISTAHHGAVRARIILLRIFGYRRFIRNLATSIRVEQKTFV